MLNISKLSFWLAGGQHALLDQDLESLLQLNIFVARWPEVQNKIERRRRLGDKEANEQGIEFSSKL